jgi:iron complex outermembrane receptor protein
VALGTLWMPLAPVALAQPAPDAVVDLGRVEVTGSNIPRIDGESGLPLQVMTRAELDRLGAMNAQDILARISANQSYGSYNEAMGEGSVLVGYTAASLRGLGAQRTLILLDGRRLAPYALSGGQSVDLSSIPMSAIERVEILQDGASAIYGTDAIGGVINFVLRKDYAGAEVNATALATEHGGGGSARANVTAGVGALARDRYNAFVSIDYYKQDALAAAARDSTRTAYLPALGVDNTSAQSFPANFMQGVQHGGQGVYNPTIPASGPIATSCAPPVSLPTATSPGCRYDYASVVETIPESEKLNVLARATWQLGASAQLFAEGLYYSGKVTQRVSPTPVGTRQSGVPMTLPPSSPYYPAAYVASVPGGDPTLPLEILYRTVELGPRVDEVDVDQWNAIAGLQGRAADWDYVVAANLTANRQRDYYQSGMVSSSRFGELLRSGVVDPFAPNTPDVLALMRATEVTGRANDNRASNYGADARATRTLVELPAGPLALALGIEARRESLSQANADFVTSGDISGANAVPSLAPVSRRVWSTYAEIDVPLTRALEADLAVRYDHYSDFGGTTNPKLTLRWQPLAPLLVRASFGTGFRAPTLSDLFQPQSVGGEVEMQDPVRCPVTGDAYDCEGLFPMKSGGNPALQPETSRQMNAGFVVEPMAGVSASVDYYRVALHDVIDLVANTAIFADFAHWAPNYVVRGPPDPQHPGLDGPIAYVVQYQTNVGDVQTSGIDIDVHWRGPATAIGRFDAEVDGTYVLDYTHTGFASDAVVKGVGQRGALGTIARYRQVAQVNWTRGPWGATLANTYQSGYAEPDLLTCEETCTGTRRVGTYSVWDVQGRYSASRDASLAIGVRNLLDRAPPLSNQTAAFTVGMDPSYADPRGRMFYATLHYAFR